MAKSSILDEDEQQEEICHRKIDLEIIFGEECGDQRRQEECGYRAPEDRPTGSQRTAVLMHGSHNAYINVSNEKDGSRWQAYVPRRFKYIEMAIRYRKNTTPDTTSIRKAKMIKPTVATTVVRMKPPERRCTWK